MKKVVAIGQEIDHEAEMMKGAESVEFKIPSQSEEMKSEEVHEIMKGQISVIKEGAQILRGSPKMVQPLRMVTWAQAEYDMELESDKGDQGKEKVNEEDQVVAVEKDLNGGEI
jgi:uncharacterized protein with von Willebrand factor type A (vWA) domain